MGTVTGSVSIIFLILELLTAWKVFVKYGEPGWKGLIPFYSDFVEYGKVWNSTVGIVYVILVIISTIGYEIDNSAISSVFGVWFGLAYFVINIIFSVKKAKAFGKGAGIAILLIFFPFIGNLILGFGSATYQKKA